MWIIPEGTKKNSLVFLPQLVKAEYNLGRESIKIKYGEESSQTVMSRDMLTVFRKDKGEAN